MDAGLLLPVPLSFYRRSTTEVAVDLLGKVLRVSSVEGDVSGIIVETEAYLSHDDAASHAHRGRTPRNKPMFEAPGHLYVYFIYGVHYCVNTVAYDGEHEAGAVLIRAVQPWQGLPLMARRRGLTLDVPDVLPPATPPEGISRGWRNLTNGPGKLTAAFGIGPHHNGLSLEENVIAITCPPAPLPPLQFDTSRRIGIRQSAELMYRYTVRGNAFVSRAR